jgi:hypothetical protein
MKMTRKHFKTLANALLSQRPDTDEPVQAIAMDQWLMDVQAVARAVAEANPRFSYSKFFQAVDLPNCETSHPEIHR